MVSLSYTFIFSLGNR